MMDLKTAYLKLDISVEELAQLIRFGKVKLESGDIELVLRRTEDDAIRINDARAHSRSGCRVIVPKKWLGKRVAAIRLE